MDIGAMAREVGATIELVRGAHARNTRDERAGPDLCRILIQGDGIVHRFLGTLSNIAQVWDFARETHYVTGATASNAEPGTGRVTNVELKGQRLVMRILNPKSLPVFLREEPRGMELYVPGDMPDTMMTALKGRTVREVVGIDSDHVIMKAEPGGNGAENMTVLKVRGRRIAVAPAPADVDTWWLDTD